MNEPVRVFDILEEGGVPLLMSMEQMQNLYLKLSFVPGKVLATCESFKYHQEPLSISTSGHAVMDLLKFIHKPLQLKGNRFQVTNNIGEINIEFFEQEDCCDVLEPFGLSSTTEASVFCWKTSYKENISI